MFEGTNLFEIRYADARENSLLGVQMEQPVAISEEEINAGQIYLKDCSFILDGISRISPFLPVSPLARQHFLYIQSFSFWEAGVSYFTRRKALDSYLLCYTYEGSGELEYQDKTYILKKGDVFLIDCRQIHQYRTKKTPWKHSVLHFQGIPAGPLFDMISNQNGTCFHLESSVEFQHLLETLLRAHATIHPARDYQVSSYLTNLLLYVLMSSESYLRLQQNIPDQIVKIVYYLNQNFTKEVSLDELSDLFSISKYHLCRSFRKYTGFTLVEYVTQLRIERAKELLCTTSLPAAQIGFLVGIHDENYFYRLFRKQTGMSPQKYRKN